MTAPMTEACIDDAKDFDPNALVYANTEPHPQGKATPDAIASTYHGVHVAYDGDETVLYNGSGDEMLRWPERLSEREAVLVLNGFHIGHILGHDHGRALGRTIDAAPMAAAQMKAVREALGETQEQFAERLNAALGRSCNRQRINDWERQRREIPSDVFLHIAHLTKKAG